VLLDPELLKKTGVFSLALGELVALVIGGFAFGSWLDQKLGWSTILRAVLPILGLIYSCWRIVNRYKSEVK
jgi:hypothetical protein